MPRLPIGPANTAPPLRCERLEDRSLLSSSTLYGILGDLVFVEPLPCEELPADGVVLEEGQTAIPYEETLATLEWTEGSDGFIADEWYYEDELYYEDGWYYEEEYWDDSWYSEDEAYYDDSWYYEDETYYEEDWYYEEEVYYDDSWYYEDETYYEEDWYYEEEYYEETWYYEEEIDGDGEFLDSGGMSWEEYEEVWLERDRGIDLPVPAPGKDDSDWSWTLADVGELTDLDDGMVYAMALSGGIAIPDAPATTVSTPTVDLLPLPVSTLEPDAGVEAAPALPPALPPATTAIDLATPADVEIPAVEESDELPPTAPIEDGEAAATALPALAVPSDTDDHLTEEESLELNEDLPVG